MGIIFGWYIAFQHRPKEETEMLNVGILTFINKYILWIFSYFIFTHHRIYIYLSMCVCVCVCVFVKYIMVIREHSKSNRTDPKLVCY